MADVFSQARLAFAADSGEKTTMSFTGTVKDGVVVLPPGVKLPEGMEVQLTVPDSASPEEAFVLRETASPFPTVGGLPDDLAINHDSTCMAITSSSPGADGGFARTGRRRS